MRAAAQIEPVALLVDFQRLVGRNGVDQLDLEVLAFVAEHFLGLVARPHFLGEGLVARDDLLHLLFDDRQVFQRERLVAREVVIKAVLDHRADGDLRARPQRLHRFGQHVGGVVPDQLQRARVVAVEEFDFGIALDRVGEIGDRAVERHGHGAFGQRGRNALGDIEPGGALGVVPACAVGKGQRDHQRLLLLTRCLRMQVSGIGGLLAQCAGKENRKPRGRGAGNRLYVNSPANAVPPADRHPAPPEPRRCSRYGRCRR